jgi:membrane-associated phospholipid phosphatase
MLSLIRQRLRDGAETQPAFDRRSRLAYGVVIAELLIGSLMFFISGFRVDPNLGVGPPLWAALALVSGWLARRVGHAQIAAGLETTGLVYAQGFISFFVIYPLMTLPLPLIDVYAASADALLGFHWPDFAELFRFHDNLTWAMKIVYRSFSWQPALVAVALCAANRIDRAWSFVTAAVIGLCITALVGTLLPALPAISHFAVKPWPLLATTRPEAPAFVIHQLKSGVRFIDQPMLTGVIGFPSFHATSAVLFAWALFPMKSLRWPAIFLNLVMLVATIVIGAHYLVDLFAGCAIAILSIRIAQKAVSYASPTVERLGPQEEPGG